MENSNNKIITMSFIASGVLLWLIVNVLLEGLSAFATGSVARVLSQDIVHHGLPVVCGVALIVALQFNAKVVSWADEVVAELRKIVWPSRKDTTAMTIVVCIMLLISGVALGIMDVMSGSLIDWLVHFNIRGLF